jgi:hypothetical protein
MNYHTCDLGLPDETTHLVRVRSGLIIPGRFGWRTFLNYKGNIFSKHNIGDNFTLYKTRVPAIPTSAIGASIYKTAGVPGTLTDQIKSFGSIHPDMMVLTQDQALAFVERFQCYIYGDWDYSIKMLLKLNRSLFVVSVKVKPDFVLGADIHLLRDCNLKDSRDRLGYTHWVIPEQYSL